MDFCLYWNIRNPHITLHGPGCSHVKKGGGTQDSKIGGWECFDTEEEMRGRADTISNEKNLPIEKCCFCVKQGRL